MKKYLSAVLVAAVAVFGAVSQAAAYFEYGNLVRVVYDAKGTTEVATDLGAYNATTLATTANATNSLSGLLSNFAAGTNVSDLSVAYYINDYSTSQNTTGGKTGIYTSGTDTTQAYTPGSALQFKNAANSVAVYYRTLTATNGTVVASASDPNSYYNSLDQAGTAAGTFNGFVDDASGEAKLQTGSATADYVDMYLFYYAKPTSSTYGNQIVATIRTWVSSDGTLNTVINPATSAVPIPGAVWLLGSGLLGLMGVRRKHS